MYYISMVSTTKGDKTEKLAITLPKSLLHTIDIPPQHVHQKSCREYRYHRQCGNQGGGILEMY